MIHLNLKKLTLTLVALLAMTTGAWADDFLYLMVNGTSATLKYDGNKGADDPYLSFGSFGNNWQNAETARSSATTITVDATCKNFQGTSLSGLFFNFTALTTINNLENLNMANVTDISGMFRNCSLLTAIDVSSFNTAQVTNMNFMFMSCTSLTTLDLSSFNTASVTKMTQMFDGCSLLENIYVGDGWSTAAVTVSNNMFRNCSKLPNYASSKVDKTNAHTGEGGYLKVKPAGTALTPDETRKVWTLEKMPAGNVELQVEYYPAMLTLAASPADGGKVELDGAAAPVEWTPETWTNVSTTGQQEVTSGDITLTATGGCLKKESDGNLFIYASYQDNNQTFTISTEGDGFTRIEMTMEEDYWQGETNGNPHILPLDGWTFSGQSAVWEGEATKKLVCQSCTTTVSKITFYRGSGLPVGVEKDETGNIYVKKDVTVKVKATPEEGYEFASWADDASITTAEREITMGDDDLTVTANFTAKPYDVTLTAKNDYTIEAGKATVTVDGTAATPAEGKISGVTKGQKVAITAATGYKFRSATAKKTVKLQSITISGITIYYAEGDSWADAIKRDENKNSGLFIREGNRVHHPDYGQLVDSNTQPVLPDAKINANESYKFIK